MNGGDSSMAMGLLVEDLLEDEDSKIENGQNDIIFLRNDDDPLMKLWNEGGGIDTRDSFFLGENHNRFNNSSSLSLKKKNNNNNNDYIIYEKIPFKSSDINEHKILTVSDDGRLERSYMFDVEYEPNRFIKRFNHINSLDQIQYNKQQILIRSLIILIDFSSSMMEPDFKPTRLQCVIQLCSVSSLRIILKK